MAAILLVHWNAAELDERAKGLRAAGHSVRGQHSAEVIEKWGDWLPDVCVLSLDRLPSHTRQVAEWIWEAKKRRAIPLLFAGGAADKVTAAKKQFPSAAFCVTAAVPDALSRILAGKLRASAAAPTPQKGAP